MACERSYLRKMAAMAAAAFLSLPLGVAVVLPASAGDIKLDLNGSLGEGGFDRYVPPVTNPIFNETPLITTELRPIFFHQKIPSSFPTGGGDIDVVAAQLRMAVTNRFGLLATTDGHAWADFDAALPDSSGFADLAIGAKYAILYEPAAGEIVTIGARYTVPTGNLNVGAIELSGNGAGYLHGFVSAMKVSGKLQLQGNVGLQQGLSSELTSFAYASGHVSYEAMPGFYPLVEVNGFFPYDGGDQLPGSKLTGFDVADLGSSDPVDTITVAGGFRWRLHENAIMGAAFEYNLNESSNSLFDWRAMLDMAIHF